MLTQQQYKLLTFIYQRIQAGGVPPSFDEMRDALELKSKSGVHRLVEALVERGYLQRLPNRARALAVKKLPDNMAPVHEPAPLQNKISNIPAWARHLPLNDNGPLPANLLTGGARTNRLGEGDADDGVKLPMYGKIAAGTPIEALQDASHFIQVPERIIRAGYSPKHYYCLLVEGDSMCEAGILNGDTIVIERTQSVNNGDIAVVFIDNAEATLKRIFYHGEKYTLKPENRHYRELEFSADRISVQGRLAGLIRKY